MESHASACSVEIAMHRIQYGIARRFGAAFFVPALLLSGCAMGGDTSTTTTSSEAHAMQQRFIVRYTDGSMPERDSTLVADRVADSARGAGLVDAKGVPGKVTWLRRLAVGADVVSIEPALDPAQAGRLLEVLGADPDIEYAEPDGRMGIDPMPGRPMRGL